MDLSKLYMPETPLEKILKPLGLYDPSRDPMRRSKKRMLVSQQLVHDAIFRLAHNEKSSAPPSPPLPRKRQRFKCRKRFKKSKRPPFHTSMFMQDYVDPRCRSRDTRQGKQFRYNYRMPWVEVDKLVRTFKEHPEWLSYRGARSSNGTKSCPLEMLIMGVLYWMGDACSWRTIENLSNRSLSQESFRKFAPHFWQAVATHIAPDHIVLPETLDDVAKLAAQYEKRGFPGAIGSVDGVQIAWEACPFAWKRHCTGKEKVPTLGFNVTVDHDCRFQHVSPIMAGRYNDLTKSRYDDYITLLRSGKFADYKYTLRTKDGTLITRCGPYLICDNGYHAWVQLMQGSKHTAQHHLVLWSTNLESCRKDVERAFGQLKKRFRVLKVPNHIEDCLIVNNMFITCCTLHNILLDCDEPFKNGDFVIQPNDKRYIMQGRRRIRLLAAGAKFDASHTGYDGLINADPAFIKMRDPAFEKKRNELAWHYMFQWRNKLIVR